jgi:AcrR family transcriptional regulator
MKKEILKTKIFDAAYTIVAEQGVEALNVRDVARASDCSLGSIYNAFENFQSLQLHINARVLGELFHLLQQVLEHGIEEGKSLRQTLKELGLAYIEFGNTRRFLWKSVFENFPADPIPDWYKNRARAGIYRICHRMAEAYGHPEEKMRHVVGFFWSSVHGMSAILLNRKMEMVSELFRECSLEQYVTYSLEGLV